MRPRAAATLALLAVLAAGCGSAGKPHFQPATGWHVLSGLNELAAANVDFSRADRSMASPPSRTVATLRRGGIVIWAMVSRQREEPPTTPLPLRLIEALPSNPFEGFRCAPAVPVSWCDAASGSVRRLVAQLAGYYVDLYVFFGTDRPTAASLAAADAELARLQFPREHATAARAVCPARSGRGAYETSLTPSSGPPGSVVTVSGHLPVIGEDGSYGGQTATRVDAYWNLDFAKWWTALTSSPLPSTARSPVRRFGSQSVRKLCRYRFRVTVPSVPRGRYPIVVLSGDSKSHASFAPVSFRVTRG